MKIAFVPLDNRPVSYDLPLMTADLCNHVKILVPDIKSLGGLENSADIEKILNWLEKTDDYDYLIVSLDTIAYGGLVQSRRSSDELSTILLRLEHFKSIIKNKKVLAFSSIMRISDNNINTEEKPYWDKWGKKIFKYSYDFHKNGTTKTNVPREILDDYLKTRNRNFEINKLYLKWQKEGVFDKLIFSKDDCAEYGFNVTEAEALQNMGGLVKTGADEIPLLLLANCFDNNVKICPIFTEPEEKNLISYYEDISIERCVENQIELANCSICDENSADIILIVNNFIKNQGEIVMRIDTKHFEGKFLPPDKPFAAADVRFANGADNEFVSKILPHAGSKNFIGYSGWNTSANSLGSLISLIKVYFYAVKFGKLNEIALKKLNYLRFSDDWAYQANIRQKLPTTDETKLNSLMKPYEKELQKIFNVDYNVKYSLPWNRLFEVRIEFI